MPRRYQRRYRRRRAPRKYSHAPYKDPRAWAKAGATAAMAYIAYKKTQMLNVEVKNFDYNQSGALNPMSTATPYIINCPGQGDTAETRDGNSVKMLGQYIRYNIDFTTAGHRARVILFKMNASNGASPTLTEVLEFPTNFDSFRNLTETRRIKVLYDKIHTASTDRGLTATGKIARKMGHHIKFNSATGSDWASIEYGGLGLVVFNDQSTDQGTISIVCRSRYVDN